MFAAISPNLSFSLSYTLSYLEPVKVNSNPPMSQALPLKLQLQNDPGPLNSTALTKRCCINALLCLPLPSSDSNL